MRISLSSVPLGSPLWASLPALNRCQYSSANYSTGHGKVWVHHCLFVEVFVLGVCPGTNLYEDPQLVRGTLLY